MVMISLPVLEMLRLAVHDEGGVDFGIRLRDEPAVRFLVWRALAKDPVRGTRAPHGKLRLHDGIVEDVMVLVMDVIVAVLIPNEILVETHIAYVLRGVYYGALLAARPHVGALAAGIDDLEIYGRPCRACGVKVVFRKEDHYDGGAILECHIGVPPLECTLSAVRANAVL